MLFLIACASPRQAIKKPLGSDGNGSLNAIRDNNISNRNFSIQRIEFEVNNNNERQKFLVNLSYKSEGEYLISLRNYTGIEALRILISGDSLKANDRINRKFYTGRINYLEKKYGLNRDFLNVLFGDILIKLRNDGENIDCKQGKAAYNYESNGKKIRYIISCKDYKVINTDIYDFKDNLVFKAVFDKFMFDNGYYYPRNCRISLLEGQIEVKMQINRIVDLVNDSLSIIPGKNYEKIILK